MSRSRDKERPRDPERVRHMLEAARAIMRYTTGRTLADFLADDMLQGAVERRFEILGEAATHISAATQAAWPTIEWREAKNFRNLIAHEYFRVDYATVWHATQVVLPQLIPLLEDLLVDLDQQFGPDASV